MVSTVHDSIVIDAPKEYLATIASIITGCFTDLPRNISNSFGVDFNLPLSGEISYGDNMKDLEDYAISVA